MTMLEFELWLAQYGLNAIFVGLVAWVVLVEIPLVFVLHHQIGLVRKSAGAHLDELFPSVWNYPPKMDVVNIPRIDWLYEAALDEHSTVQYKYGWDKAKIVVLLVGISAIATQNYWLLVLLPIAITSVYQGKLAAAQAIAQQIFDLKEQPWITRNRHLNHSTTSMHFDNLPLNFPNNPIESQDIVGESSFHRLDRT